MIVWKVLGEEEFFFCNLQHYNDRVKPLHYKATDNPFQVALNKLLKKTDEKNHETGENPE